ncbi:hypothetical protein MKW92_007049, partial [Papaver armeniacum]
ALGKSFTTPNKRFYAARCWISPATTVSQAETSALLSTIDWCHELQIDKVLFVSDNANLLTAINDNSCSTRWEDQNLVQNYVLLLSKFCKSDCKQIVMSWQKY